MSDADRLDGRTAIVTGAGQGIGEAIAIELGARGARVLATDIDAGTAARTAATIEASGGTAEAAALDVADWAAFHELVADFAAPRRAPRHPRQQRRADPSPAPSGRSSRPSGTTCSRSTCAASSPAAAPPAR